MDIKETKTTTTTTTTTRRPQWWTSKQDASWEKAKADVAGDWAKLKHDAADLHESVADKALAFGHEARAKFTEFNTWSAELEKTLSEDWKKTEESANEGWAKVEKAVKHGWERAKKSVKS